MAFAANLASVNCSLLTLDPLCSSEMGLLAEIITFCDTGSPDVAQVHTRGSKHKVLLLWILLTIVLLTQRTIFHLDSDWAKLACRRAAVTHLHIHLIPAACFAAERPGCVCVMHMFAEVCPDEKLLGQELPLHPEPNTIMWFSKTELVTPGGTTQNTTEPINPAAPECWSLEQL